MEQSRRIEDLVREPIFVEPADEFWENNPARIVQRLGLHASITPWQKFLNDVTGVFATPAFRVTVAGAFTLFLFFLLSNHKQPPRDRDIESLSVPKAAPQLADGVAVPPSPLAENVLPDEKLTQPELRTTSDAEAFAPKPAEESTTRVAFAAVTPLPYRSILPMPLEGDLGQELIPLANASFLVSSLSKEEDSRDLRPAAFGSDVSGRRLRNGSTGEMAKDLPDQDSDFAETAWIVQESPSLSEKKSIWLSFLAREKDPTYRSLGIYNLALVLSRIAEESGARKDAQKALKFFTENEASLRFQMSDRRYDAEIKALLRIASQ